MAPGRKTGGGSRKGIPNKNREGIGDWCRRIVEDAEFRKKFLERARAGTLPPAVETMLFHYAYGRPVEQHVITGANNGPLQVVLVQYADDSA